MLIFFHEAAKGQSVVGGSVASAKRFHDPFVSVCLLNRENRKIANESADREINFDDFRFAFTFRSTKFPNNTAAAAAVFETTQINNEL